MAPAPRLRMRSRLCKLCKGVYDGVRIVLEYPYFPPVIG